MAPQATTGMAPQATTGMAPQETTGMAPPDQETTLPKQLPCSFQVPLKIDGKFEGNTITRLLVYMSWTGVYTGAIEPQWTDEAKTAFQMLLKSLGFHTGKVDGNIDTETVVAMQRWLHAQGYDGKVDGIWDSTVVKQLQEFLNSPRAEFSTLFATPQPDGDSEPCAETTVPPEVSPTPEPTQAPSDPNDPATTGMAPQASTGTRTVTFPVPTTATTGPVPFTPCPDQATTGMAPPEPVSTQAPTTRGRRTTPFPHPATTGMAPPVSTQATTARAIVPCEDTERTTTELPCQDESTTTGTQPWQAPAAGRGTAPLHRGVSPTDGSGNAQRAVQLPVPGQDDTDPSPTGDESGQDDSEPCQQDAGAPRCEQTGRLTMNGIFDAKTADAFLAFLTCAGESVSTSFSSTMSKQALQSFLKKLGLYNGPLDGNVTLPGKAENAETSMTVRALQKWLGEVGFPVVVDSHWYPATIFALQGALNSKKTWAEAEAGADKTTKGQNSGTLDKYYVGVVYKWLSVYGHYTGAICQELTVNGKMAMQSMLRAQGFYGGPIDGKTGFTRAMQHWLISNQISVPQSGRWDKATTQGLQEFCMSVQDEIASVEVPPDQNLPLDGAFGQVTIIALKRFLAQQGHLHAHLDGVWDTEAKKGMQTFLKHLGFYTGEVDGKTGFTRAMQQWLDGKDSPTQVTGQWDPKTTLGIQKFLTTAKAPSITCEVSDPDATTTTSVRHEEQEPTRWPTRRPTSYPTEEPTTQKSKRATLEPEAAAPGASGPEQSASNPAAAPGESGPEQSASNQAAAPGVSGPERSASNRAAAPGESGPERSAINRAAAPGESGPERSASNRASPTDGTENANRAVQLPVPGQASPTNGTENANRTVQLPVPGQAWAPGEPGPEENASNRAQASPYDVEEPTRRPTQRPTLEPTEEPTPRPTRRPTSECGPG
eukprot:TRINITY_DN17489_c0_g1_i5.p1 TRINITY_DN17489_c0_g1~~TRINITY_DN17489_c0_g1_i5.p1  ORF type:complete len:938 (-),score=96.28 TRINITY_DN17489_c0_g1_i5:31-2844(-)